MRSIIEDPYHYILNGDDAEELYDYRADPDELQDPAGPNEPRPTCSTSESSSRARRRSVLKSGAD